MVHIFILKTRIGDSRRDRPKDKTGTPRSETSGGKETTKWKRCVGPVERGERALLDDSATTPYELRGWIRRR